jgi:hypothetical protein
MKVDFSLSDFTAVLKGYASSKPAGADIKFAFPPQVNSTLKSAEASLTLPFPQG